MFKSIGFVMAFTASSRFCKLTFWGEMASIVVFRRRQGHLRQKKKTEQRNAFILKIMLVSALLFPCPEADQVTFPPTDNSNSNSNPFILHELMMLTAVSGVHVWICYNSLLTSVTTLWILSTTTLSMEAQPTGGLR